MRRIAWDDDEIGPRRFDSLGGGNQLGDRIRTFAQKMSRSIGYLRGAVQDARRVVLVARCTVTGDHAGVEIRTRGGSHPAENTYGPHREPYSVA